MSTNPIVNNIFQQMVNTPAQSQFNLTDPSQFVNPEAFEAYNYNNLRAPQQAQNTAGNELTPEAQALLDQINNNRNLQSASNAATLRQSMNTWNPFGENHPWLNLIPNAIHDVQEIGTGFVSLFNPETRNQIGNELYNFYANMANDDLATRARKGLSGMYNTLIGDVTGVTSSKLGDIAQRITQGDLSGAREVATNTLKDSVKEFQENPLIFSSVVAPKPTSKLINAGVKTAGRLAESAGIPIGEATQAVGRGLDSIAAAMGNKSSKLRGYTRDFKQAKTDELKTVIEYNRGERTNLPKELEPLNKKFNDFNKEYNLILDDYALLNPREIVALQYVRDKLGGNTTIQEVRRMAQPQLEALMEGVTDPSLRFRNRLNDFNHEVNTLKKEGKKVDLKDEKLLSELSNEEQALIQKHFTSEELASFEDAGFKTVGEVKQYMRDAVRDAWSGDSYVSKAASNAKYQENMSRLAGLAQETGDPFLKYLHEGFVRADSGVKPFTFAGAEIPAGAEVSNVGRRFAGISSSREFGTATSEAIAKAYQDSSRFVDDVLRNKLHTDISNNLLRTGTIDGETALFKIRNPKDARYVSRDALEQGKLAEAVNGASETARDGDIVLDKRVVNALKEYTASRENPFGNGVIGDVYNTVKDVFLASGNYLGGNILSGAMGTMLNSGSIRGLVSDLKNSLVAENRLAKALDVYREPGLDTRKFSTQAGKVGHKISRATGGYPFTWIDAKAQNLFAEMNANALLRRQGIQPADRLASLNEMPKAQLGQLINDLKNSSMMNNRFRLIPNSARKFIGLFNPFVDWLDTSMQASYHMYAQHPYLIGATAADFLGNIALDKELQNRLNLNVHTDKMLKSYVPNPKTGQVEEVSVNFIPQMTSIELLTDPKSFSSRGIPFFTAFANSLQGKNLYGRPMERSYAIGQQYATGIQGDKRYWVNPSTNKWEQINQPMADEVLSTTLRNLSGIPQAVNKTYGPTVAGLASLVSGKDVRFYQPYDQSVFGSFSVGQPESGQISPNIWSTGDPGRERSIKDVLTGLGTYYKTPYIPEDTIRGTAMRSIKRNAARRARQDYYRLMNQE